PAATRSPVDDAGGELGQVGAAQQLDLGAVVPLAADLVVAGDCVAAKGEAALVPPRSAGEQVPGELGSVGRVDAAGARALGEAGVVEEGGHEQALAIAR